MIITETTTVAEVAAAFPAAVRIFERHLIDFCCGGRQTLRDACEERGLTYEELARALAVVDAARSDHREWMREPLPALVEHIVGTYHDALRKEMPRLEVMADRAVGIHGATLPVLRHVPEILGELSADLNEHMWKEEHVLFPAIQAMASGASDPQRWIAAPIQVMEEEHDRAGELLAQLRRATDGYLAPDWSCATLRALYEALARLEREMHVHVHLENNILFPRALEHVRAATKHFQGH
jgi:regulator of cell morphogenesis and NO signaling